LQQLANQHADEGLIVIGINSGGLGGGETQDNVEAFLEQTGIHFPVVWDDGSYSDWGWPTATAPFPRQAVVGRDGVVVYIASEYQGDAVEAAVLSVL
jgi:hypothetical protein